MNRILLHLEKSSRREKANYLHIYDEEFFSVIDTESKAYWLGFMMADGCIKSSNQRSWVMQLALAEEDGDMVAKFRDEIAPLKDLSVEPPRGNNVQNQVRLSVYSNRICYDLMKLNCGPRKSLTLIFPPSGSIPTRLMRHFIRGYFDGDGGFVKSGRGLYAKIISSHPFVDGIGNILSSVGIPYQIRRVNNGLNSTICVCAGVDLCRFYRYLYHDSLIFLPRKRQAFDRWITGKVVLPVRRFNSSVKRVGRRYSIRISFNAKWYHVGTFDDRDKGIAIAKQRWSELSVIHIPDRTKRVLEMHGIWKAVNGVK